MHRVLLQFYSMSSKGVFKVLLEWLALKGTPAMGLLSRQIKAASHGKLQLLVGTGALDGPLSPATRKPRLSLPRTRVGSCRKVRVAFPLRSESSGSLDTPQ